MSTKVEKLSQRLEAKRQSLLRSYEDDELHKLRITLRRMRGYLKRQKGGKARRLRRELASLSNMSNAARDWDTLVIHARTALSPPEFALVEPVLEQRRSAAHRQVEAMLCSKQWSRATRHWNRLIAKKPPHRNYATDPDTPDGAMRRADSARRRALASETDKSWHKFRIAIKDLRYTLDNIPGKSRDSETRKILAQCKSLQDDLGNWHDAVEHQRVLQNFINAPDWTLDKQTESALTRLCRALEQERDDRLENIRSTLSTLS